MTHRVCPFRIMCASYASIVRRPLELAKALPGLHSSFDVPGEKRNGGVPRRGQKYVREHHYPQGAYVAGAAILFGVGLAIGAAWGGCGWGFSARRRHWPSTRQAGSHRQTQETAPHLTSARRRWHHAAYLSSFSGIGLCPLANLRQHARFENRAEPIDMQVTNLARPNTSLGTRAKLNLKPRAPA